MSTLYEPDLLYAGGKFVTGKALRIAPNGRVEEVINAGAPVTDGEARIKFPGRALLPGMVDVHSHTFQRTIRGAVESRAKAGPNFWSWRDAMYRAAGRFNPEELYGIARMAFLEMALAGITTVGEFHYIHRAENGAPYANPNETSLQIVRAAENVGIRVALLRVAYVRAGYNLPADPGQIRFIESDVEEYLQNVDSLRSALGHTDERAWVGVAPHSVRAVPLGHLQKIVSWAQGQRLAVHMHVAEQPAENSACIEEYGCTPFALLDREGLLHENFTAIHGIHISSEEIAAVARAGAIVGACPTTERNLGDGILPADELVKAGVRIAFGSDSLTQIDPLENAREIEYNLRLKKLERAVLDNATATGLSELLLRCATQYGAESVGAPSRMLEPGVAADFFTVNLEDPSIAGSSPEELLASIVFSLSKRAIRDVAVGGRLIIQNGQHPEQEGIIAEYVKLMQRTREQA